jgi:DNA-binding IclR family transcriptional regulator
MPRSSSPERDARSVIAVERACDVLLAVAASSSGPLGIKDVAGTLGLSPSTVHRLLAALLKRGLVEQDAATRRYSIGHRLMDVTLERLRHLELPAVALPHMRRLRDATTETVALTMIDGWTQSFVAQVESRQEIRQTVRLGQRLPLHFGGSGKAALAWLSQAELDAYLRQPEFTAAEGRARAKRLVAELAEVRERRYARSAGERVPGAASVAAPVRNHLGAVVGCLSVSGPAARFSAAKAAEYGRQVISAADDLSRDLGAPPRGAPVAIPRRRSATAARKRRDG